MDALADSSRFVAHPRIIATDLQQELVLLDPRTQQMFRLNQTGRLVWLGLAETDLAGLAGRLSEAFDVSAEQAGRDVRDLLTTMLQSGLIEAKSGDA
ncbi:MAG TPA: PqqD family protein [Gemmatimonadales bacterium]